MWTEKFCFQQISGKNQVLPLSKLTQNTIDLPQPKHRALDKFCSISHFIPDWVVKAYVRSQTKISLEEKRKAILLDVKLSRWYGVKSLFRSTDF